MDIWYIGEIDTVDYIFDPSNPETLRAIKKYKQVKFDPTLLESVRFKVNQSQNTKLQNLFADLERIKFIDEPMYIYL